MQCVEHGPIRFSNMGRRIGGTWALCRTLQVSSVSRFRGQVTCRGATYGERVFATARPVVRDHVEAIFLAVVDEILDVIIARVASDTRNDARAAINTDQTRSRQRDTSLVRLGHLGQAFLTYQMKPLVLELDSSQSTAKCPPWRLVNSSLTNQSKFS